MSTSRVNGSLPTIRRGSYRSFLDPAARSLMAVNRVHAFAQGLALPPPERLTHLPPNHPHQELARAVWKAFRSATVISDEALLGVDAWPINLGEEPNKIRIGPRTVVR